ncbi:unnamed protein product [Lepeophtheirus salmonis]|uniref:(salmon louse) hypothetical protein n=1 Tax=Lepeophtheirus salmonis TaxID=72036 RepID=A0A7R8CHV8_LEPSM|nr:unnamed protein product [Lepeophtheirus salmonis]CAF2823939.1 unnamed protein product [Lepeophtheirus salmonis]
MRASWSSIMHLFFPFMGIHASLNYSPILGSAGEFIIETVQTTIGQFHKLWSITMQLGAEKLSFCVQGVCGLFLIKLHGKEKSIASNSPLFITLRNLENQNIKLAIQKGYKVFDHY